MKTRKRVTYRKHGGDDRYSWSVFVDGVEKWNGMSRDEATWRAKREQAAIDERENKPAR